ncbi:hypothetical protein HGRIS_013905 [Hohenbuehelia grisea]|uniref:Shugoshin C-terminal domain-containing protein n=1 Tax=Hohenbuehelia grisea TaxID=104357 RepID=A0ABR3IX41_9AGAR
MSRRDSRVSTGARQTDALHEFEAFKKKFLLANKHITKLNSTLSVRIEELNAQISTLYVENLRLRSSEIALTTQLKREREKSNKVMAEAETVSQHFVKQLSFLRQTLDIHPPAPLPNKPPTPVSPRARKPPGPTYAQSNPEIGSPSQPARVARAPMIPDLLEDDEPLTSDAEAHEAPSIQRAYSQPSSSTPSEARSRVSQSSRRGTSHAIPLPETPTLSTLTATRKKVKAVSTPAMRRRESGLLIAREEALSGPRPPSPTVGSPLRAALDVEEGIHEDNDAEHAADDDDDHDESEDDADDFAPSRATSITQRRATKDEGRKAKAEAEFLPPEKKERKRKRREQEDEGVGAGLSGIGSVANEEDPALRTAKVKAKAAGSGKGKLTDVTNAQRSSAQNHDTESHLLASSPPGPGTASSTKSKSSGSRLFLASKAPADLDHEGRQPPPSSSSDTVKSESSDPPKVPRKKDAAESLPTPRPSSSPPPLLPVMDDTDAAGGRTRRARVSVNYAEPKLNTKMRKPGPPSGQVPAKKRASTTSVPSSSLPALQTLPSSLLIGDHVGQDSNDAREDIEHEEQAIGAIIVVRTARKFGAAPKPYDDGDEAEDSDGAQADAEYVPPGVSRRKSTNPGVTAVNRGRKEGRRRAGEGGSDADGFGAGMWEERRHSMAV